MGTSTSGASCILHNSREPRTNGLVFKCCILHKITVSYIKNSASCRISGPLAVRNECSVYSIRETQNQDSTEKSGRLVTLVESKLELTEADGAYENENQSIIHSFTGAYSPGWTFGLPFGVS
jgi:hypothetical protein